MYLVYDHVYYLEGFAEPTNVSSSVEQQNAVPVDLRSNLMELAKTATEKPSKTRFVKKCVLTSITLPR